MSWSESQLNRVAELTDAQLRCLRLVPFGSSKRIAQRLGISHNTVNLHIGAGMAKLGEMRADVKADDAESLAALARGEALPEQAASGAGELDAFIEQLLAERKDFVQQRGMEAVGPLMGAVMGEFRGRVDGALVSERLRVKLGEFLG